MKNLNFIVGEYSPSIKFWHKEEQVDSGRPKRSNIKTTDTEAQIPYDSLVQKHRKSCCFSDILVEPVRIYYIH